MGDTEQFKKPPVMMPSWTIEAVKFFGSIVVALALAWVKFSVLSKQVDDDHATILQLTSKLEAAKDVAVIQTQKTSTLEIQQTLSNGELRDSLKRIEDEIKDMKTDLKALKVK